MNKWHYITQYIKHRINAQSLNDIHSPFVFDIATKIIKSKELFYCFITIEKERQKLLRNDKIITVEDFGAGSKKLNSKQRKISDIAKISLKPVKQAQSLFKIVNYFGYKNILELGTSLGITSAYLAKPNKSIRLTTIEGSETIANVAKQTFEHLKINNITQLIGNFNEELPKFLMQQSEPLDLVFIDGNHQKEATLNYFEACLPKLHNDALVIFDDIYWSKGMTEAWKEIKLHQKTQVTIDLFHLGLVFFRKEQPKQHFTLKL